MFDEKPVNKIAKEQYPFLLRQIPRLPESMNVAGTIPSDQNRFLCVIGSRQYSRYGKIACEKLIAGLREYPVVIVSGLAIGIDSIAHEAALAAGLATVAFPGSGLTEETLYPPRHLGLAKKIVRTGGAILSPFAPEIMGQEWTFPVRNRLMAGMSHATLIIEARRYSGTLLTADYAVGFNRDVLAVPGDIFNESSYGPHMLISRGATPVTSSLDILEVLGFEIARNEEAAKKDHNSKSGGNVRSSSSVGSTGSPRASLGQAANIFSMFESSLSPEERRVVEPLRVEGLSASDLIEKTGMSSQQFSAIVSELELRGIVMEADGIYRL